MLERETAAPKERSESRDTAGVAVESASYSGYTREAVLALQRSAGNQAVAALLRSRPEPPDAKRAPLSTSATRHLQRTREEAVTLVNGGREWNAKVWTQWDLATAQALLLRQMNAFLAKLGLTATVEHGFFKHNKQDPLVRTGQHWPYSKIVKLAKQEGDGGVQFAWDFREWCAGTKKLAELTPAMRALALITHWAEVGRGYYNSLYDLYAWIDDITAAPDRATARSLWDDVNVRYPPSLGYKVDEKLEFADDAPSDESSDDMPMETIPQEEIAGLPKDLKRPARDFLPTEERAPKRRRLQAPAAPAQQPAAPPPRRRVRRRDPMDTSQ